jgi:hypothetical protein
MNCFNHRDVAAVGLCKSCGKALCGDCLTELPNGLACKGACEPRVNMINRMLDTNSRVMNVARHQVRTGGMLSLLMAGGCATFAIWAHFETGGFLPYFLGMLAVVTFITGVLRLSRKQQYPQLDEQRDQIPTKPSTAPE